MHSCVLQTIRQYRMLAPGDTVYCAVSGGPDSMALLVCLLALRERLGITLCAAHFNHRLRGAESDGDERFVREFCARQGIALTVGSGTVTPGAKGLEAAARDARYAFFDTLPGKVATAHTADDNAETVLLHLLRGTGLNGLGGIAPTRDKYLRPLLLCTRGEVLAYLAERNIPYRTDSTNDTDLFLRNRLRHDVLPLLARENPQLARSLSQTALRLRADEACLAALTPRERPLSVSALRRVHPALRRRALAALLQDAGVREPEARHIALAESLVFSEKPAACAVFPGGVTLRRRYDSLGCPEAIPAWGPVTLPCPGSVELPALGLRVRCTPCDTPENTPNAFTVRAAGAITLRTRQPGDAIRLPGGTKTLKKLFIDSKIPRDRRDAIPVAADAHGILGVAGYGADRNRYGSGVRIVFESVHPSGKL